MVKEYSKTLLIIIVIRKKLLNVYYSMIGTQYSALL